MTRVCQITEMTTLDKSAASPTGTVLRREGVRVEAAPVAIGRTSQACEPEITIHRDGDAVRQIEIRCRCGEHILLDCTPA